MSGVGRNEAREDRLLSTPEAGAFLGISPRTLEDWRLKGGGPCFRKLGGRIVRYLLSDLQAFVEKAARINTGGGLTGLAVV